jgi:ribosomal 50S subunit-recycling heat shock protein
MRLDLFLKASRLVLRRSIAQQLCDAGAVFVNDIPSKSAREVRPGDRISIRRRDRELVVRITSLPATKQVARADAPSLYEVISDTAVKQNPAD